MNKLGKKTDYSSCGFYSNINGVSTDLGQKQNGIPHIEQMVETKGPNDYDTIKKKSN
jgi:hypothetical protein